MVLFIFCYLQFFIYSKNENKYLKIPYLTHNRIYRYFHEKLNLIVLPYYKFFYKLHLRKTFIILSIWIGIYLKRFIIHKYYKIIFWSFYYYYYDQELLWSFLVFWHQSQKYQSIKLWFRLQFEQVDHQVTDVRVQFMALHFPIYYATSLFLLI